ncbi:MAG: methyltransferase domain-containing protein [Erysipelotrichaceae bacterium]|nr:methyltransferase domain-containing protein [Erysipelotrichaceae bacterium]
MKIICPICKHELIKVDKSYVCENKHCFDIAKEGYLNLNCKNSQNTGDEKEMINARRDFLHKGYYSFLRDAVNELINEDDKLLDLACGEGYYTSFFKAKDKVGVDLSKTGLKIAAKKDKNTLYLLNNIFTNPLEDKSIDTIVTIFAPIAKQEIKRLLKDNGRFILVKPNVNHLFELKKAVYDNPYHNEIEDIEIEGLKLENEINVKSSACLNNEDLNNLFMMTPYYHTTSQADKDKLKCIDKLDVSFDFLIDIFSLYNE